MAKRVRPFFAVILGYVPEYILMYITLVHLTAVFYFLGLPNAALIFAGTFLTILTKAWTEIFINGVLDGDY